VEQVWQHQQSFSQVQLWVLGFNHAEQLVKGIVLHDLDAGFSEDLIGRHYLQRSLQYVVRASVTVVVWVSDQPTSGIEQTEVNATRIHANAHHWCGTLSCIASQGFLDFSPEAQYIPVKMS
jgi:hypothetical protein